MSTSGKKFWSPGTWFSGREGARVDRAETKLDAARDGAIKAAQKTAHETREALAVAPESRPVEVARESNGQTVALLDQVAGPLTVAEAAYAKDFIARLVSENMEIRASAEAERAKNRQTVAALSEKLSDLSDKLEIATRDLKAGFERENAMANKHRNLVFGLWGLAIMALIGYAGLFYLRIAYGGIPQAIGRALGELRMRNPSVAAQVTPLFDTYLNRAEQARIAAQA